LFLPTCPSPQIPCSRESTWSFCSVAEINTPMAFSPRSARANCARCRTRMSGCFSSEANPQTVGAATDFAGHASHFRGERSELIHHRIDGVLEFQNLALHIHSDLLR